MKKILGIVVIMTILTGVLFAQELRLDGYINSGLGVVTKENSDGDNVNSLKAFGVDSEQNGYRFRLNGSFTNENRNAGIRFRMQSQATLTQVSGTANDAGAFAGARATHEFISFPYMSGWVSFLDNKINISGGIIEDSAWQTGDFWLASDSVNHFAGLGALLKITPMDGLVIGAGAQTVGRQGGGNNNTLARNLSNTPELEDARYSLHFGYTMPDVFRFGLSYKPESDVGGHDTGILYADFRYLGSKDLTAVVAASLNRLGEDFSDTGEIIISQTFGYRMDDFSLGLNAVQFLFNAENDDTGLMFNLWGSYAIGTVVPRLDAVYFVGGNSTLNASATTWHRKGFGPSRNSDVSVLSVRPSVRFNVSSRAHLEIGDMINIDNFGADDGNTLSNSFYIDLRWNF